MSKEKEKNKENKDLPNFHRMCRDLYKYIQRKVIKKYVSPNNNSQNPLEEEDNQWKYFNTRENLSEEEKILDIFKDNSFLVRVQKCYESLENVVNALDENKKNVELLQKNIEIGEQKIQLLSQLNSQLNLLFKNNNEFPNQMKPSNNNNISKNTNNVLDRLNLIKSLNMLNDLQMFNSINDNNKQDSNNNINCTCSTNTTITNNNNNIIVDNKIINNNIETQKNNGTLTTGMGKGDIQQSDIYDNNEFTNIQNYDINNSSNFLNKKCKRVNMDNNDYNNINNIYNNHEFNKGKKNFLQNSNNKFNKFKNKKFFNNNNNFRSGPNYFFNDREIYINNNGYISDNNNFNSDFRDDNNNNNRDNNNNAITDEISPPKSENDKNNTTPKIPINRDICLMKKEKDEKENITIIKIEEEKVIDKEKEKEKDKKNDNKSKTQNNESVDENTNEEKKPNNDTSLEIQFEKVLKKQFPSISTEPEKSKLDIINEIKIILNKIPNLKYNKQKKFDDPYLIGSYSKFNIVYLMDYLPPIDILFKCKDIKSIDELKSIALETMNKKLFLNYIEISNEYDKPNEIVKITNKCKLKSKKSNNNIFIYVNLFFIGINLSTYNKKEQCINRFFFSNNFNGNKQKTLISLYFRRWRRKFKLFFIMPEFIDIIISFYFNENESVVLIIEKIFYDLFNGELNFNSKNNGINRDEENIKEIKGFISEWLNNDDYKKDLSSAIINTQELIMKNDFYSTFNNGE